VLVALIVMWLRPFGVEGDPRKSLIVFPFENRTGDTDNDWLQEAAMHGLGLTLAHWDELRVFDDERTASLMRRRGVEDAGAVDFDLARRMAREAQVGTLVLGDIRREGRLLTIEAKVHDVRSGERLATEIVQGQSGSDPRFLFDSLAARILQVSGAPPGERPGVVAQTTHAPIRARLGRGALAPGRRTRFGLCARLPAASQRLWVAWRGRRRAASVHFAGRDTRPNPAAASQDVARVLRGV
jgi:TolB-like protein